MHLSVIFAVVAVLLPVLSNSANATPSAQVQGFTDVESLSNGQPVSTGNCPASGATSASCSVFDASASANLATGVLASQAECCATNPPYISSGQAGALAQFSDSITLVLPTGYTGSTVPITLNFGVDTSNIIGTGVISDVLNASVVGTLIGGGIGGCFSTDAPDFCGTPASTPLDLAVSFNVPTGDLLLNFTASLRAQATHPGSSADAADPGHFSINLPAGVSFTSGSGVLLSEAAAVPEPSSLMLLLSGIAGLGFLARRRSKAGA